MIILVSDDDRMLAFAARDRSRSQPQTYGATAAVTDAPLAQLAADEDLYLLGWGAGAKPDGSGNPTVGNKLRGGVRWSAVALWNHLSGARIFPAGWTGRVFLWISGAKDEHPEMEVSFAEMFLTQVDAGASRNGGVFCRAVRIDPPDAELKDVVIPDPSSPKWTQI